MFQREEVGIRVANAHNVQENITKYQEGGTAALLAYRPIVSQILTATTSGH